MKLASMKENNKVSTPAKALEKKPTLEDTSEADKTFAEILEIVRISQETQEVSKRIENKHRRVVTLKDTPDELRVVR